MPMNKEMTLESAVAELRDGMTIGMGGWGPRRKPMALVREILRSPLKDLTLVGFGGPEMGMLCAAGKVRKLIYGFVSLDVIPIEPHFRKARQEGSIEVMELGEGMVVLGLEAAGHNVPFLPTPIGLGTDVMKNNPELRTIKSPYADGEVLVAMPALKLDAALLHVSRADRLGNTLAFGPDPYFDGLMARAATKTYVTTEELVDSIASQDPEDLKDNAVERTFISGVVKAPFGAHPTAAHYGYGWDLGHLKTYAASATEENGWQTYYERFVAGGEAAYLDAVGGEAAIRALPLPVF